MNRDHSVVFEVSPKYCISDSFFDYDGYSISSKGFLPTAVYIMAIWIKFARSSHIWIILNKMIFLLFHILSRFVIAFLPRNKSLLISWLQALWTGVLEPKKINTLMSHIIKMHKDHIEEMPVINACDFLFHCKSFWNINFLHWICDLITSPWLISNIKVSLVFALVQKFIVLASVYYLIRPLEVYTFFSITEFLLLMKVKLWMLPNWTANTLRASSHTTTLQETTLSPLQFW